MSRRRPWEEAIHYNEDRFDDKQSLAGQQPSGYINPDPDLIANRVRNPQADRKPPKPKPLSDLTHEEQTVNRNPTPPPPPRPSWRDAGGGRSNDDRPLNYGRGPHDGEIDVDDRDDPHYDED